MTAGVVAILVGALATYAAEREGVELRAEVVANLYTWTIRNVDAAPISRFSIGAHHTYDHHAPDGWAIDDPGASGVFEAWTADADNAINRGETAEFSMRVSSRGAILGSGVARLTLADGRLVEFPDAWRPIPESKRTVGLIIGTVLTLACVHVVVGRWRTRRRTVAVNHCSDRPVQGNAP